MKTKTIAFLVIAAVVVSTAVVGIAMAAKDGQAGKSNVAHLYLYEKNETWEIVDGGAWGKMKYNLAGPEFDFVFNGHGLEPNTEYTLIYYVDQETCWGKIGAVIDSGTSNEGGNIHLADSVDIGTIPVADDENEGAKIWLILWLFGNLR